MITDFRHCLFNANIVCFTEWWTFALRCAVGYILERKKEKESKPIIYVYRGINKDIVHPSLAVFSASCVRICQKVPSIPYGSAQKELKYSVTKKKKTAKKPKTTTVANIIREFNSLTVERIGFKHLLIKSSPHSN